MKKYWSVILIKFTNMTYFNDFFLVSIFQDQNLIMHDFSLIQQLLLDVFFHKHPSKNVMNWWCINFRRLQLDNFSQNIHLKTLWIDDVLTVESIKNLPLINLSSVKTEEVCFTSQRPFLRYVFFETTSQRFLKQKDYKSEDQ